MSHIAHTQCFFQHINHHGACTGLAPESKLKWLDPAAVADKSAGAVMRLLALVSRKRAEALMLSRLHKASGHGKVQLV